MPTCPAYDCNGGTSFRVREVSNPAACKVPDDIKIVPGDQMFRCSYCGFIWIQRFLPEHLTTRRIPVGFYDSMAKPNEFFATPNHRLKPERTSSPQRRRR